MLRNPPKNPLAAGEVGKPLSRWIWMLVPLALAGVIGIAVPVAADISDSQKEAAKASETYVPYDGRLGALLKQVDLSTFTQEHVRALNDLSQEAQDTAKKNDGKIPESLFRRVESMQAKLEGGKERPK
jgi:hypothetical protein